MLCHHPADQIEAVDVNANFECLPRRSDSKLRRIIACLFFRRKTDVVEIKTGVSIASKKHNISVDRSERSRRVLKMESWRTAPKSTNINANTYPRGSTQMFMPSENPTVSFLSNLNPTARRAYSDVLRTSNTSLSSLSREAFTDIECRVLSRNTNYRVQQATGKSKPHQKQYIHESGNPLQQAECKKGIQMDGKKHVAIPGRMTCSDEDVEYDSDSDIFDFHEELRRMNLSYSDLRSATNTEPRNKRREGSISLSGVSESDEENSFNTPDYINSVSSHTTIDKARCLREAEAVADSTVRSLRNDNAPAKQIAKSESAQPVIDNVFTGTHMINGVIDKSSMNNTDNKKLRSDKVAWDMCQMHIDQKIRYDNESTSDQVANNTATDTRTHGHLISEISTNNMPNTDPNINMHKSLAEYSKSDTYQPPESNSNAKEILTRSKPFRSTLMKSTCSNMHFKICENRGTTLENVVTTLNNDVSDQPKVSISNKETLRDDVENDNDVVSIDNKESTLLQPVAFKDVMCSEPWSAEMNLSTRRNDSEFPSLIEKSFCQLEHGKTRENPVVMAHTTPVDDGNTRCKLIPQSDKWAHDKGHMLFTYDGYGNKKQITRNKSRNSSASRKKYITGYETRQDVDGPIDSGNVVHDCHSFADINDLYFNLRNGTGYNTKCVSVRELWQPYHTTVPLTTNRTDLSNRSFKQDRNRENCLFTNKDAAIQRSCMHCVQAKKPGTKSHTAATLQSADKLKCLRLRRDQEMEWLMRDAAETEV